MLTKVSITIVSAIRSGFGECQRLYLLPVSWKSAGRAWIKNALGLMINFKTAFVKTVHKLLSVNVSKPGSSSLNKISWVPEQSRDASSANLSLKSRQNHHYNILALALVTQNGTGFSWRVVYENPRLNAMIKNEKIKESGISSLSADWKQKRCYLPSKYSEGVSPPFVCRALSRDTGFCKKWSALVEYCTKWLPKFANLLT